MPRLTIPLGATLSVGYAIGRTFHPRCQSAHNSKRYSRLTLLRLDKFDLKMQIAITGSSGVLGRQVLRLLDNNNYSVTEFSGNVSSASDLNAWLSSRSIDAIIHLAAMVATDEVKSNPQGALKINAIGTWNILNQAAMLPKKPWVFIASTSHVYAGANKAISEDSVLNPISTYGETKLIAEHFANYFETNTDLSVCTGRIFSFFHDTQQEPFLFPSLRHKITQLGVGQVLKIHGGNNIRDMLPADKVAEYIVAIMRKKVTGIINIGSGKGTSIREFAQELAGPSITIDDANDDSSPTTLIADTSRLDQVLKQ
ncbi:MAG: nucleoside-diphosphate-sugar epimerase [Saprospiraceae bacterium]